MVVNPELLAKVKTALRRSHNKLDDDISDDIAACLRDLQVCGVSAPAPDDPQELDPLILSAVKLHAKATFTEDPGKSAEYLARYNAQKTFLMGASEYSTEAATDE